MNKAYGIIKKVVVAGVVANAFCAVAAMALIQTGVIELVVK